jgi:exodeoxyribonuclease V gamma subunit
MQPETRNQRPGTREVCLMPGLKIYTSNRLEILSEKLAKIVKNPVPYISRSPLSQEVIIVQSKGMERWLSMELARLNGICANCRFPFPNAFLDEMIKHFSPDIKGTEIFDPDVMTFSLLKILPAQIDKTGFESLKRYLTDDTNNLRLFQLSERIADLFDQYEIFRPEMIFKWEENREEKEKTHVWQARLWREIARGNESLHRAALHRDLIGKMGINSAAFNDLYGRISVFGISALPPFHMRVIKALSGISEVNMFLLNPCSEYWADTPDKQGAARIKSKYAGKVIDAKDLHIENGNSLLSSMGELGRAFLEYLVSEEDELIEEYSGPEGRNLLSCIQSDILFMKERKASEGSGKFKQESPDNSLQFHSCHSPMRETEVLYDNLLAMFEEDSDLLPNDIVVMAPDIEVYAPFVCAVFGAGGENEPRIPFSVSDRSIRRESGVIEGFLSILDQKKSRFKVSQVLSVLECPGIKDKFGLNETDLEKIRGWIRDTRIRWGYNRADKGRLGFPEFKENTWKAGIERLLLGYAISAKDGELFSGILPFEGIEGTDAKILGKFLEFMEKYTACVESLGMKRTINGWHSVLTGVLDTFFEGYDEAQQEIQLLRRIAGGMLSMAELSGYTSEIEIDAVKYYMKKALEHQSSYTGFMSGGVTFCSMLPMRSIPFKVICLIGMNNDAFPRNSYSYGFDLMAADPKPGDRSRKKDDKYLFLEALISSRRIFYVSYVGQSIQDNTPIPPSVSVSELLDYVNTGFGFGGSQMITMHKLQAFSPAYFSEKGNLFSYSSENMLAACSLYECRHKDADNIPLISQGLCEPPEELKRLGIESLSSFFANPAKYFLRKRLGIYLEEKESVLTDSEDFISTGLDNYLINQELIVDIQAGKRHDHILKKYKAEGKLPHGNIGENFLKKSIFNAGEFLKKSDRYKIESEPVSLDLDTIIGGFSVTGRLANIYENRMLISRYAKMKAKDILWAWIHHLAFCSHSSLPSPETVLLCMDKTIYFKPVEKSVGYLVKLLDLYRKGLMKPLYFFPDLSLQYVEQVSIRGKEKKETLRIIENKWQGSDYAMGLSEDPYYNLCFRNTGTEVVFGNSFVKNSESVFLPVLSHLSEC